MKALRIGLIGCGNVGTGLCELIERNAGVVAERTGRTPVVARALVRDAAKPRRVNGFEVTADPDAFFKDDLDVIVELVGGIEPARTLVLRAIASGRHVVTANKALLALRGGEIFHAVEERGVRLGFEASVCGGIPVVRALASGLVANRIESLSGIVNGTCNFLLTRLEEGRTREQALAEARERGLTEADPTLDLDGTDGMQKLQILSLLAFGVHPDPAKIQVEGIQSIEEEDVRSAAEFGCVLRHVVSAKLNGSLSLRVEPLLLPKAHPLAAIREENNAVLIRGDAVGELLLAGKGAGPLPTASAVLSDILEVADGASAARPRNGRSIASDPSVRAPFYLRFPILDVPGVIGLIATALGNRGISIQRASATLTGEPGRGDVKILAHECDEGVLRTAVTEITRLPIMAGRPVVIRVA